MLNWLAPHDDWLNTQYPKLKNNPPLLLYGNDFEIIDSVESIIEEIEDFSAEDDYRQTKKIFYEKFIPFGKTGGGDLYCFYLDALNEIQGIIIVWHDANEAEILAENLQGFIFRSLLECVVEPYEQSLVMYGNFKQNITNQLSSHKKYLNPEQISFLEDIYSRNTTPLLTYAEFNQILNDFGFTMSDNTFEYQEE